MPLAPLIGLVAGAVSAGLYLYGLTLTITSMFVLLLAPLPLWIAGLGWGATAAGLAGAVGAIVTLLVGDPLIASVYAGAFAIPTAILAHLAVAKKTEGGEDRWFPRNALLGALIAIGLVQALVVALVLASSDRGLVGTVRDNLSVLLGAYGTETAAEGTDSLVDQWDSLVLGLIVAVLMVAQAGTGALAQGLLAAAGARLRPTPAFWALRAGDWMRWSIVPLLVLAVALDATGAAADGGIGGFVQFLAMAFVLALGVGFLLQGLAVMHALTRGMRAQPFILAGVYFIALAMQPFGTALFALIGFFDRWGNFRERFGIEGGADMED
jgi:hypothetical protein